jgi:hypothetical protein
LGHERIVPHEFWWDNPTTVVAQIFRGRERRPTELYSALASHYALDPLSCMPARGNEKSHAENRVKVLRKQWATPVPQAAHLDALNASLRDRCLAEAGRTVAGYEEAIGTRFAHDRAKALPLPAPPPLEASRSSLPAVQVLNSGLRWASCACSRATMLECIWLTRDSLRSSVAPISFIVMSS